MLRKSDRQSLQWLCPLPVPPIFLPRCAMSQRHVKLVDEQEVLNVSLFISDPLFNIAGYIIESDIALDDSLLLICVFVNRGLCRSRPSGSPGQQPEEPVEGIRVLSLAIVIHSNGARRLKTDLTDDYLPEALDNRLISILKAPC